MHCGLQQHPAKAAPAPIRGDDEGDFGGVGCAAVIDFQNTAQLPFDEDAENAARMRDRILRMRVESSVIRRPTEPRTTRCLIETRQQLLDVGEVIGVERADFRSGKIGRPVRRAIAFKFTERLEFEKRHSQTPSEIRVRLFYFNIALQYVTKVTHYMAILQADHDEP